MEIVRPHAAGQRVTAVGLRCGARRAIEPASLQLAWQAVTDPTEWRRCSLAIELLPWQMECRACNRRWEGQLDKTDCDCGSSDVAAHGTDELTLRWIEIDDTQTPPPDQTGEADESACRGERAEAQ